MLKKHGVFKNIYYIFSIKVLLQFVEKILIEKIDLDYEGPGQGQGH